MLRKYLYGTLAFVLAFGILFVSLLKLSTITFAFSATKPSPSPVPVPLVPSISYPITLPGRILQDSILWPFKAARDGIWYTLTIGHLEKAELALFLSDKRLTAALMLFEKGKGDLATSTITKSDSYMETAVSEGEKARQGGADTSSFLTKLAIDSLKHREIIEKNIMPIAPDGARPAVSLVNENTKNIYQGASSDLESLGKTLPNNPFEGQ